MLLLMTDEKILQCINEYPNPNYIWVEIWQINRYEIQLWITTNCEKLVRNGTHKVLRVASLYTDEEHIDLIKNKGKVLKKFLKQNFKNSEVHSNLHYR